MKETTIWMERMKTASAHCLMRMVGNVVSVGRRHERSLHINVTQREERMENQREWQAWWSQISVSGADRLMPAWRQPQNIWQLQKKHNRCVVDAGRFHYPVIDIPPDTICPRCDLIFNDTAELQRHLASMVYPPPEGHSLVINAETPASACGSDHWQKIRDRWRARRAERETKTHKTAAWMDEGRRDDGEHELGSERIRQGRQQGHGREAAQRRPQDALRTFPASAGSQRRSLRVLDDEYKKPKEQLRAYSELAATKGKGHGLGPTGLLQALSGGAAQWERPMQLVWQSSSKRGTIWNRRGHSVWYLIASWPKCTTQLCAVSNSSSAWHNTESTFRGALGQTGANRLLGQAPSGASERALSAAIEQN